MLTEDLKVKNGIRFVFAQSEIILLIIEILISLHEIFLKPLFLKLLKRELNKEEKMEDHAKKLHPSLIKLLKNLGCIEKLYHNTKTIVSFVREIKKLMEGILLSFHVRYLEKMSEPESDQSHKEEDKEKEKETEVVKKTYAFDHSRTFFRNLVEMIKSLKQQETHEKLKEEYIKRKNQMDVSENDLKKKYIDAIFAVPGENLRPINSIRFREQEELHYKPHLQTANSKIFKVLAKPELEENEENLELNTRLNNVKELLTDSPAFKKLKQDEFYKLVHIFTSMDTVSSEMYSDNWKSVAEEPRAVFSQKEIIRNCFSLIIDYPNQVTDAEKIFIIKLVRCYISEAVESKQNHKLSVDKWNADYYTDDFSGSDPQNEERSELVKRQHEIEECGGSKLLLSILKENLFEKTELLNETLLLGIIYLFNGNTHCQNSLLSELLGDPENTTFMSLKNLIKNIGNFLIEVRKFKENEKKRVFSYKIVDSYDHFDSKENILVKMFGHKTDKFEIETELNYELALCRIFRFLQLFCENNNIEMKKFLMTQKNRD
jgi:inositol 1,4,5-triphosphate receptor type 1/inositol 1,4,5-triphosphate receptor type 3